MTYELHNAEVKKIVGTSLDFSQYIGLLFRKDIEKTKKAISLGTISHGRKQFDISINGIPNTTSYKGEAVNTPVEYAQHIKEGRESELNHDTLSYIEVNGEMEGKKFIGVFFSIEDALAHMEKVEKGELVADHELVTG